MKQIRSRHPFVAALSAATVVLSLSQGASPARAGDWAFTATPYVWATDLGVQADLNGRQVVDEKVSVGDLVEKIDMIFQGRFDVRYRQLGLSTDVFDVTMSDEASVALPQGAGTGSFAPEMRMTIFDLAATVNPSANGYGVTGLAGMRLIYERADVDATYELANGTVVPQSYSTHETLVAALTGVRFARPISGRWGFQSQADVSTGATRYTWSLAPSLNYTLDARGKYAVSAGYRHMHIAFKESDGIESDMTLSGALLGFRMAF